jgi:hypothetical protein
MERKVSGTIADAATALAQTESAFSEINEISGSLHNFQFHTVTVEKDGQLVEIEVPIDDIDLLDDFDDDDLTSEGERALGVIDIDYDTTSDADKNLKSRNKLKLGEMVIDDEGNYTITCPYTGSTEVYQVSTGIFASYITDKPFRIEVNLADTKANEED